MVCKLCGKIIVSFVIAALSGVDKNICIGRFKTLEDSCKHIVPVLCYGQGFKLAKTETCTFTDTVGRMDRFKDTNYGIFFLNGQFCNCRS